MSTRESVLKRSNVIEIYGLKQPTALSATIFRYGRKQKAGSGWWKSVIVFRNNEVNNGTIVDSFIASRSHDPITTRLLSATQSAITQVRVGIVLDFACEKS